jgi:hypothetical protein
VTGREESVEMDLRLGKVLLHYIRPSKRVPNQSESKVYGLDKSTGIQWKDACPNFNDNNVWSAILTS